ncbi:hypothetical protein CDAR_81971 [Caerostris darwini]|uniref:Uncharacterized protein n=1 Tax=Caerostris darwini TaxID=1538125 RepID=A0AAV4V5W0_9ARAC|nr:hypothetical protein CDAR_81971 [Caerostris darwini]
METGSACTFNIAVSINRLQCLKARDEYSYLLALWLKCVQKQHYVQRQHNCSIALGRKSPVNNHRCIYAWLIINPLLREDACLPLCAAVDHPLEQQIYGGGNLILEENLCAFTVVIFGNYSEQRCEATLW